MFCPKCGTQNPDNGKFCRSCGTDLGNVSDALAGRPVNNQLQGFEALREIENWNRRKKKPIHWEGAIGKVFSGLAFLIAAIALAVTGVAGGHAWWFWLLFPAFGAIGGGIAQIIQLKKMEKGNLLMQSGNSSDAFPQSSNAVPQLNQAAFERVEDLISSGNKGKAIKVYRNLTGANSRDAKNVVERIERGEMSAPQTLNSQNGYEPPPRGSIYDTGELNIPPSVTESTTRHLEINKEGETMTLPQKK